MLRKRWDQNILIIPAYLGKGVVLRVSVLHDSQEEPPKKELGSFDGKNTAEICYLKADVEINVHVEGAYKAAVMGLGLLCTDSHGEINTCESHSDKDARRVWAAD